MNNVFIKFNYFDLSKLSICDQLFPVVALTWLIFVAADCFLLSSLFFLDNFANTSDDPDNLIYAWSQQQTCQRKPIMCQDHPW